MAGSFIISLDFELRWGGVELWDLPEKRNMFLGARKGVEEMLALFESHSVRATWATVGFLFAKKRYDALKHFPVSKPTYVDQRLNYYRLFENNEVGDDEHRDPYHYAYSLISKIKRTPGQELGSHTFSHYYCNEPGQNGIHFQQDLLAAQNISQELFHSKLYSLVFPRNQYNTEYLRVLKQSGFLIVRTNPSVWFWNISSKIAGLVRAVDTLTAISGRLSFSDNKIRKEQGVILLPASRFFRPYKAREKAIQRVKIARIKKEMSVAAEKGEHYHLWWHPHNFGESLEQNMAQLTEIIIHFNYLRNKWNWQSRNMQDFVSA